LVDEVVREPDWSRSSVETAAEAEELWAVAKHSRNVFAGQFRSVLQISVHLKIYDL
jgi:hypothetical protein